MKRNIRILYLAVVALLAGVFTACNSDDDYTPGEVPEGAQVYFPNDVSLTYEVSADDTYVDVPVKRVVTDEALTVAILSTDESGLFTVPENLSFTAGSEDASLRISFDGKALEMSKSYEISLLLKNEFTAYGDKNVKVTIMIPEPWTSLGKGMWREDILTAWFDVDNLEYEVEIEESDLTPGYYRIINLYADGLLDQLFGGDMSSKCVPTNFLIDATDPDHVIIPQQEIGVDLDYGPMIVMSALSQWVQGVTDSYGKLENGVITFPVGGVCLFDDTGGTLANTNGLMRIVLPGAEVTDYSLAAVYDGMKISADGKASALLNLTFGADVASYKYVVAEGDVTAELATVVAGIVDGSLENIAEGSVDAKSIAVELDKSGMLSFVAVPYNAEGEAKTDNAAMVAFFFPGAAGGSVPDIECALECNTIAHYYGDDYETQYPSTSWLAFRISATDVKEIRYYINETAVIEEAPYTHEELIANYGTVDSEKGGKIIAGVNAEGEYIGLFNNLKAGTSYTLLMQIESTYGKKYMLTAEHTTTEIPYTGELVLGTYNIADATTQSESSFDLVHTADPNVFIVEDFILANGSTFIAKYDSAASTLTLDGVEQGYEDDGIIFGSLYGWFNREKDQAYAYISSSDLESENVDDPCVFGIDPATKTINSLKTYMFVSVYTASTMEFVGNVAIFTPASTIALDAGTSSVRTKALNAASQFVNVQNAGVQRALKSAKMVNRDVKCMEIAAGERQLRTVEAKAEPCQRKVPSLERKDIRNSQAVIRVK